MINATNKLSPLSWHSNAIKNTGLTSDAKKSDFTISLQSAGTSANLLLSGAQKVAGGYVNASVFRSPNSSDSNPIMLVKGTDVDGKPFEEEVDVSKVDTNSASVIEMFAINGYLSTKDMPRVPIMPWSESSGNLIYQVSDAFTKYDFLTSLKNHMETQRYHGNWQGYMQLNTTIEYINDTLLKKQKPAKEFLKNLLWICHVFFNITLALFSR